MNQKIEQISVVYHPMHDRMLMRVGISAGQELTLWLTRRFVRILWGGLKKIVEMDPMVTQREDAQARQDVMAFQSEKAISETDFSKHYHSQGRTRPMGDNPLLVSRLSVKALENDHSLLIFSDEGGASVRVGLDRRFIFSLCKLLRDTSVKAEWDLQLELVDPTSRPQPSQTVN